MTLAEMVEGRDESALRAWAEGAAAEAVAAEDDTFFDVQDGVGTTDPALQVVLAADRGDFDREGRAWALSVVRSVYAESGAQA